MVPNDQALVKSEIASCPVCSDVRNSAILVHLVDLIVKIVLNHRGLQLNIVILLTNMNPSFSNIRSQSFHSDFREEKMP